MKKIFAATALALLVSIGGAARAEAPPAGDAGLGEKAIVMFEKLADIIDANKADCAKMADGLNKFVTDNSAAIKDMQEKGKGMTKEQKDAWTAKYKDRLEKATTKMMGGMEKCQKDQKVMDAMKKMPH
jgi:hypothetical protein